MIIAVDFDGTVVTHEFPNVGDDVGAVDVLKRLVACGHKLILWTMRSGGYLIEARAWFERNNIPLWGINKNPEQHEWTASPKAYAELFIDDAALNVPLIYPDKGRPYVDWFSVEHLLREKGLFVFPLGASQECTSTS